MWLTSFFVAAISRLQNAACWTHYDSCMHGGERKKPTSLLHSSNLCLAGLSILCNGAHQHKPWGLAVSSSERVYPLLFCKRFAKLLREQLLPPAVIEPLQASLPKVYAYTQPRRGMQELISEYKETFVISDLSESEITLAVKSKADRKLEAVLRGFRLGKDARVLDMRLGKDSSGGSQSPQIAEPMHSTNRNIEVVVGVFWSVEEFTRLSRKLVHPFDTPVRYPARVAGALQRLAVLGPEGIAAERASTLDRVNALRKNLEAEEMAEKKLLNADVASVLGEKQILLFHTLLKEIDYDDMSVVESLRKGIPIVGHLQELGIWKKRPCPPSIPIEALWARARTSRKLISAAKQPDYADTLWAATIEERDAGGIRGPFTEDELTRRKGPLWVPAKRFGIQQGTKVAADGRTVPKIRAVDDFSKPGTNAAFGSDEKVIMLGLDQVVSWSRGRADSIAEKDGRLYLNITDENGQHWGAPLHSSWTPASWAKLFGKVADLKAAYKQLPAHPKHGACNIVAVYSPDAGQHRFFECLTLMFGQTAAVYGFLRFSRALAALLASLFSIVCVEFFDDFTLLDPAASCESATASLVGLFEALGWQLAMAPEKWKSFAPQFDCLGVTVDLASTPAGITSVSNKKGRVAGIRQQADLLFSKGVLGFKDALSMRSRISYAETQIFGRVAAPLAHMLSRFLGVHFLFIPYQLVSLLSAPVLRPFPNWFRNFCSRGGWARLGFGTRLGAFYFI